MNWEQIKTEFSFYQGIAMIVPYWNHHIKQMDKKIESDPEWYANDQVEAQYKGPYRVHLQRRRAYLKAKITNWYLSHHPGTQNFQVIDIGCGDGQHLIWLQDYQNIDLYGSDYNLLRLRRASKNVPSAKLLLMDILDIPFDDNYFQIILCNHVLEHILDDQLAFKELSRILSYRGILILGIPNEGSKWWQLAYDLESNLRKITDHVHFYTADDIYKLIESANLRCLETKYIGYGLPHFTADSIFRNIDGMDDIMEKIGQTYFKEQASSLYFIITK